LLTIKQTVQNKRCKTFRTGDLQLTSQEQIDIDLSLEVDPSAALPTHFRLAAVKSSWLASTESAPLSQHSNKRQL